MCLVCMYWTHLVLVLWCPNPDHYTDPEPTSWLPNSAEVFTPLVWRCRRLNPASCTRSDALTARVRRRSKRHGRFKGLKCRTCMRQWSKVPHMYTWRPNISSDSSYCDVFRACKAWRQLLKNYGNTTKSRLRLNLHVHWAYLLVQQNMQKV